MLFCDLCLFCIYLDLPLTVDVERPNVSYQLTLGARYTSDGKYDRGFAGSIAAIVLMPTTTAPAGFSSCVIDCLESMSIDTNGTSITSLGFNESTRTLSLVGNAPDSDYEKVLQSLTYVNKASSKTIANVNSMRLTVDDGVGTTKLTLPVSVVGNQRRRRSETATLLMRRRSASPFPDLK